MKYTNTRRGSTQINQAKNKNVGQVLPDNKGCSLRPLRSLAHSATSSAPLAGEVRRSRVGGLLKDISTVLEKVKARMRGCSLFNLVNPSPALRASSPARGEENSSRGFTLIELLVVVLIIGILAAVALPQYQKAVWRSRNAQLKQLVTAVAMAEQLYFLTHGTFAANFNELDLDLPLKATATTSGTSVSCGVRVSGRDSIREGDNFYIALNTPTNSVSTNSISVVARWTDGKYKCTGFSRRIASDHLDPLRCAERKSYMSIKPGDFCISLEHATLFSQGSATTADTYTLP